MNWLPEKRILFNKSEIPWVFASIFLIASGPHFKAYISEIIFFTALFLIPVFRSRNYIDFLFKPLKFEFFKELAFWVLGVYLLFFLVLYLLGFGINEIRFKTDFSYYFHQLFSVSFLEEFFFRFYLMGVAFSLFSDLKFQVLKSFPERFFSLANLVSAFLFATCHFLVDFQLVSLAVFFPSLLFGALFIGPGGLWLAVFAHFLANILSHMLIGNIDKILVVFF